MDGELVTGSSSTRSDERGGGDKGRRPLLRYKEAFEEACPFYLSIGMTYDQYWDGPSTMAVYYRKAYLLKRERRNEELWLQGMYFYEALIDTAPVLNALSKIHKPLPYRAEPIPLTEEEMRLKREEAERRQMEENKEKFKQLAEEFNRKFREKGGKADGS